MKYIFSFIIIAILTACKQGTNDKVLITNITGELNDVLVVLNKTDINSVVDSTIKSTLEYPFLGLPQEEVSFKAIIIDREGFNNFFQLYRNIIDLKISSNFTDNKVFFGEDVYAKTQSYLKIEVKSTADAIEIFNKNAEKIRKFFKEAEIQRLQKSYANKFSEPIMKSNMSKFGIKVEIPANYKLDKDLPHFSWISFESPDMSQGILIYDYPYIDTTQFNEKQLLTSRDSILKLNVEGPTKDSYMTTEHRFPIYREVNVNKEGMYTVTLRGLWKVENDFMGGPFISYSFPSKDNTRIICIDAYVYNPKKDKRNFIMQMEAILKTAEYTKD
ncbi:MAG: DUF4837 family protein [Bacteroidales bacterium]|nr:DUF4837 family protein [Bacteroidales bacterium]